MSSISYMQFWGRKLQVCSCNYKKHYTHILLAFQVILMGLTTLMNENVLIVGGKYGRPGNGDYR